MASRVGGNLIWFGKKSSSDIRIIGRRLSEANPQPAGCAKALIGLFLVFVFHIPKLGYDLLRLSYAAVFHNRPNLTASPVEHLRLARRILRRCRNCELLYPALELRFSLERMAQNEIYWSEIPWKEVTGLPHKLIQDAPFLSESQKASHPLRQGGSLSAPDAQGAESTLGAGSVGERRQSPSVHSLIWDWRTEGPCSWGR